MPQFDRQSARRISKTVREHERRKRNERPRRQRHANKRAPLVRFELVEELVQWSGATVKAVRRKWDPTANGGDGAYVTPDCEDFIYVADSNDEGHNADVGGFGTAEMHARVNEPKWVGSIISLCCPGDEQGICQAGS